MTFTEDLIHSPLFKDMNAEEVAAFIDCAQPRIYYAHAGSDLVHPDDLVQSVGLLLSGKLLILQDDHAGRSSILELLVPGDLYGQEAVFCRDNRSVVRLSVAEDASLLLFPEGVFYRHCAASCHFHQVVTRNMLEILSQRLIRLKQKIAYLSCSSLKGKVALYLLNQAQAQNRAPGEVFRIPFNREDLAAYLNTRRPSLSRVLTQMKDEGLIDFKRSDFSILDEEGLKRIE